MKFKKIIATILAAVLILSTMSIMAFAFDNDEFDIESLTWDDIMEMDNYDFQRLLNQFEREYDPFGTYETNPLTSEVPVKRDFVENDIIAPQWSSGVYIDDTAVSSGTHEMITAKACGFLYADKGFWGGDENGSILIALVLAIASTKADIYEIGFPAFAGHYYDPDKDVEKNNTAKTNAKKFYDEAVSNYNSIEFTDEFIKNVGNMIHFIQDACEPHHAAGMHNVDAPHLEFESFVNDNLDKLIDPLQGPIHEMHYNKAITTSVDDLVHNAAKEAKVYAGNVGSFLLHINWMETAFYCLQYAIRYTATILYKLSLVAGIPLIK